MHNVICFHLITEPNAYLSNWYPSPFEVDGTRYTCAEQYIMQAKALLFGDGTMARAIMATDDQQQMQDLGRKVSGYSQDVWDAMKQVAAYRAARAKFAQSPLLGDRLLATGDAVPVECAYHDKVWGIGMRMGDPDRFFPTKWRGKNLLGYTLMLVREEMRRSGLEAGRATGRLHEFAVGLAQVAHVGDGKALEGLVDPEFMRSLGLEMDAGASFRAVCGLDLGNVSGLEGALDRIDDSLVLGSAIFSEGRRCTHWSKGFSPESIRWLELAAQRLVELTKPPQPE